MSSPNRGWIRRVAEGIMAEPQRWDVDTRTLADYVLSLGNPPPDVPDPDAHQHFMRGELTLKPRDEGKLDYMLFGVAYRATEEQHRAIVECVLDSPENHAFVKARAMVSMGPHTVLVATSTARELADAERAMVKLSLSVIKKVLP